MQLICPDAGIRAELGRIFELLGPETVWHQAMAKYPSGGELARSLRTFSPQAIFLSFEQLDTALAVVRFVESEAEGLPVVAVHSEMDLGRMLPSLHVGARDFLTPPFEPEQLTLVVENVRKLLKVAPLSYAATDHIYSFLPAKPGVGTTTVAVNASAAFARESAMKVLLVDLDLTCGMVRFLLKLPQDLSIVDALARAEELDVSLWPQLVSHRDGIDVLHSGSVNPHAYLEAGQVQGLIDFARTNYRALFFDMSGNLERHSLHVMQESKQVFVVCNPDAGSLYLGREKIQFLRTIGLSTRISAIVNRSDQALAVPTAKIEDYLGVPVAAAFVDDTFELNQSVQNARSLFAAKRKETKLARQFRDFVRGLMQPGARVAGTGTDAEVDSRQVAVTA